jgi:preprotein translocase subunit SecG
MVLNILINSLLVIHVIVALLLILVVLMQRPKNEGLGAAFGGGMTDNLFGAQTTNVLQTFTRNLGVIFFVLAVVLSVLYAKQSSISSEVERRLRDKAATPAVEATPAGDKSAVAEPETGATDGAAPSASVTPASGESDTNVSETEAVLTVDKEAATGVHEESPATPENTPSTGE